MSTDWLGVAHSDLVDAGDGHRMHQAVIGPWLAMQAAAAEDGVDCQLASSYRDFDRQLSIWNRKWQGQLPLLNSQGQPLDPARLSDTEKMHAILTWSALPGGSRHHWGTDVDVYDARNVAQQNHRLQLVDSEYRDNGPCARLASWLDSHAHQFGFVRPFLTYTGGVACELWHLSHRSTASYYEQQRSLSQLADCLAASDMAGKQVVIDNLAGLYQQYVLNQGAGA